MSTFATDACAGRGATAVEFDPERMALLRTLRKGALLPQLLRSFLEQTPQQLAAIAAADAAGDLGALGKIVHALKSASHSIGANRFAQLRSEIETAARLGDEASAARHCGLLAEAWASVHSQALAELDR